MLRKAAQANSVRTADEQICDVWEAGLSLRDITYQQTHASREIEKAVIFYRIWYQPEALRAIAGTALKIATHSMSILVQCLYTWAGKACGKAV